ncbi:unnamed protein product, partial [Ectocarpus sp. 12 AP-2014]
VGRVLSARICCVFRGVGRISSPRLVGNILRTEGSSHFSKASKHTCARHKDRFLMKTDKLDYSTTKRIPNSNYASSKRCQRDGSNAPIFGVVTSCASEQWSFENGSRGVLVVLIV